MNDGLECRAENRPVETNQLNFSQSNPPPSFDDFTRPHLAATALDISKESTFANLDQYQKMDNAIGCGKDLLDDVQELGHHLSHSFSSQSQSQAQSTQSDSIQSLSESQLQLQSQYGSPPTSQILPTQDRASSLESQESSLTQLRPPNHQSNRSQEAFVFSNSEPTRTYLLLSSQLSNSSPILLSSQPNHPSRDGNPSRNINESSNSEDYDEDDDYRDDDEDDSESSHYEAIQSSQLSDFVAQSDDWEGSSQFDLSSASFNSALRSGSRASQSCAATEVPPSAGSLHSSSTQTSQISLFSQHSTIQGQFGQQIIMKSTTQTLSSDKTPSTLGIYSTQSSRPSSSHALSSTRITPVPTLDDPFGDNPQIPSHGETDNDEMNAEINKMGSNSLIDPFLDQNDNHPIRNLSAPFKTFSMVDNHHHRDDHHPPVSLNAADTITIPNESPATTIEFASLNRNTKNSDGFNPVPKTYSTANSILTISTIASKDDPNVPQKGFVQTKAGTSLVSLPKQLNQSNEPNQRNGPNQPNQQQHRSSRKSSPNTTINEHNTSTGQLDISFVILQASDLTYGTFSSVGSDISALDKAKLLQSLQLQQPQQAGQSASTNQLQQQFTPSTTKGYTNPSLTDTNTHGSLLSFGESLRSKQQLQHLQQFQQLQLPLQIHQPQSTVAPPQQQSHVNLARYTSNWTTHTGITNMIRDAHEDDDDIEDECIDDAVLIQQQHMMATSQMIANHSQGDKNIDRNDGQSSSNNVPSSLLTNTSSFSTTMAANTSSTYTGINDPTCSIHSRHSLVSNNGSKGSGQINANENLPHPPGRVCHGVDLDSSSAWLAGQFDQSKMAIRPSADNNDQNTTNHQDYRRDSSDSQDSLNLSQFFSTQPDSKSNHHKSPLPPPPPLPPAVQPSKINPIPPSLPPLPPSSSTHPWTPPQLRTSPPQPNALNRQLARREVEENKPGSKASRSKPVACHRAGTRGFVDKLDQKRRVLGKKDQKKELVPILKKNSDDSNDVPIFSSFAPYQPQIRGLNRINPRQLNSSNCSNSQIVAHNPTHRSHRSNTTFGTANFSEIGPSLFNSSITSIQLMGNGNGMLQSDSMCGSNQMGIIIKEPQHQFNIPGTNQRITTPVMTTNHAPTNQNTTNQAAVTNPHQFIIVDLSKDSTDHQTSASTSSTLLTTMSSNDTNRSNIHVIGRDTIPILPPLPFPPIPLPPLPPSINLCTPHKSIDQHTTPPLSTAVTTATNVAFSTTSLTPTSLPMMAPDQSSLSPAQLRSTPSISRVQFQAPIITLRNATPTTAKTIQIHQAMPSAVPLILSHLPTIPIHSGVYAQYPPDGSASALFTPVIPIPPPILVTTRIDSNGVLDPIELVVLAVAKAFDINSTTNADLSPMADSQKELKLIKGQLKKLKRLYNYLPAQTDTKLYCCQAVTLDCYNTYLKLLLQQSGILDKLALILNQPPDVIRDYFSTDHPQPINLADCMTLYDQHKFIDSCIPPGELTSQFLFQRSIEPEMLIVQAEEPKLFRQNEIIMRNEINLSFHRQIIEWQRSYQQTHPHLEEIAPSNANAKQVGSPTQSFDHKDDIPVAFETSPPPQLQASQQSQKPLSQPFQSQEKQLSQQPPSALVEIINLADDQNISTVGANKRRTKKINSTYSDPIVITDTPPRMPKRRTPSTNIVQLGHNGSNGLSQQSINISSTTTITTTNSHQQQTACQNLSPKESSQSIQQEDCPQLSHQQSQQIPSTTENTNLTGIARSYQTSNDEPNKGQMKNQPMNGQTEVPMLDIETLTVTDLETLTMTDLHENHNQKAQDLFDNGDDNQTETLMSIPSRKNILNTQSGSATCDLAETLNSDSIESDGASNISHHETSRKELQHHQSLPQNLEISQENAIKSQANFCQRSIQQNPISAKILQHIKHTTNSHNTMQPFLDNTFCTNTSKDSIVQRYTSMDALGDSHLEHDRPTLDIFLTNHSNHPPLPILSNNRYHIPFGAGLGHNRLMSGENNNLDNTFQDSSHHVLSLRPGKIQQMPQSAPTLPPSCVLPLATGNTSVLDFETDLDGSNPSKNNEGPILHHHIDQDAHSDFNTTVVSIHTCPQQSIGPNDQKTLKGHSSPLSNQISRPLALPTATIPQSLVNDVRILAPSSSQMINASLIDPTSHHNQSKTPLSDLTNDYSMNSSDGFTDDASLGNKVDQVIATIVYTQLKAQQSEFKNSSKTNMGCDGLSEVHERIAPRESISSQLTDPNPNDEMNEPAQVLDQIVEFPHENNISASNNASSNIIVNESNSIRSLNKASPLEDTNNDFDRADSLTGQQFVITTQPCLEKLDEIEKNGHHLPSDTSDIDTNGHAVHKNDIDSSQDSAKTALILSTNNSTKRQRLNSDITPDEYSSQLLDRDITISCDETLRLKTPILDPKDSSFTTNSSVAPCTPAPIPQETPSPPLLLPLPPSPYTTLWEFILQNKPQVPCMSFAIVEAIPMVYPESPFTENSNHTKKGGNSQYGKKSSTNSSHPNHQEIPFESNYSLPDPTHHGLLGITITITFQPHSFSQVITSDSSSNQILTPHTSKTLSQNRSSPASLPSQHNQINNPHTPNKQSATNPPLKSKTSTAEREQHQPQDLVITMFTLDNILENVIKPPQSKFSSLFPGFPITELDYTINDGLSSLLATSYNAHTQKDQNYIYSNLSKSLYSMLTPTNTVHNTVPIPPTIANKLSHYGSDRNKYPLSYSGFVPQEQHLFLILKILTTILDIDIFASYDIDRMGLGYLTKRHHVLYPQLPGLESILGRETLSKEHIVFGLQRFYTESSQQPVITSKPNQSRPFMRSRFNRNKEDAQDTTLIIADLSNQLKKQTPQTSTPTTATKTPQNNFFTNFIQESSPVATPTPTPSTTSSKNSSPSTSSPLTLNDHIKNLNTKQVDTIVTSIASTSHEYHFLQIQGRRTLNIQRAISIDTKFLTSSIPSSIQQAFQCQVPWLDFFTIHLLLRKFILQVIFSTMSKLPLISKLSEQSLSNEIFTHSSTKSLTNTAFSPPKTLPQDYLLTHTPMVFYITQLYSLLPTFLLHHSDIPLKSMTLSHLATVRFHDIFARGSQHRIEALLTNIAQSNGYSLLSMTPNQVQQQPSLEEQALTLEPEPDGFYEHPIAIFDFRSLYPSVVIAYNLCYSTCVGKLGTFSYYSSSIRGTDNAISTLPNIINLEQYKKESIFTSGVFVRNQNLIKITPPLFSIDQNDSNLVYRYHGISTEHILPVRTAKIYSVFRSVEAPNEEESGQTDQNQPNNFPIGPIATNQRCSTRLSNANTDMGDNCSPIVQKVNQMSPSPTTRASVGNLSPAPKSSSSNSRHTLSQPPSFTTPAQLIASTNTVIDGSDDPEDELPFGNILTQQYSCSFGGQIDITSLINTSPNILQSIRYDSRHLDIGVYRYLLQLRHTLSITPRVLTRIGSVHYGLSPTILFSHYKQRQLFIAGNGTVYLSPHVKQGVLPRMLSEVLMMRQYIKKYQKQLSSSLNLDDFVHVVQSREKFDEIGFTHEHNSSIETDMACFDKILSQLQFIKSKSRQFMYNSLQLSLKLIANVTYGYVAASFSGRMPCSIIADAIVNLARSILEYALDWVKQSRFKTRVPMRNKYGETIQIERIIRPHVVYGDTDSLFVQLKFEPLLQDQIDQLSYHISDTDANMDSTFTMIIPSTTSITPQITTPTTTAVNPGQDQSLAKFSYGLVDQYISIPTAFDIGNTIVKEVSRQFPFPIRLELEKVYNPAFTFTKKKYMGQIYSSPPSLTNRDRPTLENKGVETIRADQAHAIKNVMYTTTYLISVWQTYQQTIINTEYIPYGLTPIGASRGSRGVDEDRQMPTDNNENGADSPFDGRTHQFQFIHDTRYQYSVDLADNAKRMRSSSIFSQDAYDFDLSDEAITIFTNSNDLEMSDLTSYNHRRGGIPNSSSPLPYAPIPLDQQLSDQLDTLVASPGYYSEYDSTQGQFAYQQHTFGLSPTNLHTILFAHIIVPIYLQTWMTLCRYEFLLPTNLFTFHKRARFGKYSKTTIPQSGIYTLARKSLVNQQFIPVHGEQVSYVITTRQQNLQHQPEPSQHFQSKQNIHRDSPQSPLNLNIINLPTSLEMLKTKTTRMSDRGMLITDFMAKKFSDKIDILYYLHKTILPLIHRLFVLMPINRIHQSTIYSAFRVTNNPAPQQQQQQQSLASTKLTDIPPHRLYSHAYVTRLTSDCRPYQYQSPLVPHPTTKSPLLFDMASIFEDSLHWNIATVMQMCYILTTSLSRYKHHDQPNPISIEQPPSTSPSTLASPSSYLPPPLLPSSFLFSNPISQTIPAPTFDQTFQSYQTPSIGPDDPHFPNALKLIRTTIQPMINTSPNIYRCPYHYQTFSMSFLPFERIYNPKLDPFNQHRNHTSQKHVQVCGYCIGEMVPMPLRPILLSVLLTTVSLEKAVIFLAPLLEQNQVPSPTSPTAITSPTSTTATAFTTSFSNQELTLERISHFQTHCTKCINGCQTSANPSSSFSSSPQHCDTLAPHQPKIIDIEDLFSTPQSRSQTSTTPTVASPNLYPPCHNYSCTSYEDRNFWSTRYQSATSRNGRL